MVQAFELSPTNNAVMAAKGRLRRCFPGSAVSMPVGTFSEPQFQSVLVQTLCKMSEQTAAETKAKVKKAAQMHDEDRDTKSPHVVTELLLAWLLPMGGEAQVSRIQKNTREDVLWRNTLLPWRRSPLWLLIRVTLQLIFQREVESAPSDRLYKMFMVFLMSRILASCLPRHMEPDLLYVMNAKIARRMVKLGSECDPAISKSIHDVCSEATCRLQQTWVACQDENIRLHDSIDLTKVDCESDALHDLPRVDNYLEKARMRTTTRASAEFQPEKYLLKQSATVLPVLSPDLHTDPTYAGRDLYQFESWIDQNLPAWLDVHISVSETCSKLESLTRKYHGYASAVYAGNPESMSVMVLTIMELWVACDRSAVRTCPLLVDYEAAIPEQLLQSLLLPTARLMVRLSRIEAYVRTRRQAAKYLHGSIFRDFGSETSFAVRYFAQSTTHQTLHTEIVEKAMSARSLKQDEFKNKKAQYNSLMLKYNESSCEYDEVVVDKELDLRESRHKRDCAECSR